MASAAPAVVDWVHEAEVRVLGQILGQSDAPPRVFDLVADRLATTDFADSEHAEIYGAIASLVEDGEPITIPGVVRRLVEWKRPEKDFGPTLGLVVDHAYPRLDDRSLSSLVGWIRKGARVRVTRRLGQDLATATDDSQAEQAWSDAQSAMSRLAIDHIEDPEQDTGRELEAAAEELLHARESRVEVLRTGLVDVDRILAGFAPRTLTVVAALTSRGKSSLAMQLGDELASRLATQSARGIVRVFSLEMGAIEIHKRRLIAASGVPLETWQGRRDGPGDERDRLASALAELKRRPLRIMYGGGISAEQVRAVSRRDASAHGLALVIVDYLQALEAVKGDDTREREVARMTRGLKALAMDLDVPVLALAQLSRAADATEQPSLSHLRESGTIEQFADNVVFLYQRKKDPASVITVRVGKQRNGARDGEAKVLFNGELYRFQNYGGPGTADKAEDEWWHR